MQRYLCEHGANTRLQWQRRRRRRPLRYRLHHGRPEIYLRRYGVVAAVEASFDFVIVDDNSGDRSVPKLSVVEGAVVVTEVVAFDPPRLSARGHR